MCVCVCCVQYMSMYYTLYCSIVHVKYPCSIKNGYCFVIRFYNG